MKKLIALVIVAVMLLSMMPVMAIAADAPTTLYLKPGGSSLWKMNDTVRSLS